MGKATAQKKWSMVHVVKHDMRIHICIQLYIYIHIYIIIIIYIIYNYYYIYMILLLGIPPKLIAFPLLVAFPLFCFCPLWLTRNFMLRVCYLAFYCVFCFIPQTALELNGVLNSSKKQVLFHHDFLIPCRVPGLVSLLFWHSVPSSFPGSFWFGVRLRGPYSFDILFHHHWFWVGSRGLFR